MRQREKVFLCSILSLLLTSDHSDLFLLLFLTAVFYFLTLPSPSPLYKLYLALLPSPVLYLFPSHLQIYTLSLHPCITCPPHSCAGGGDKVSWSNPGCCCLLLVDNSTLVKC